DQPGTGHRASTAPAATRQPAVSGTRTSRRTVSGKTAMPGRRQDHRRQSHHPGDDHLNLRGGLRLSGFLGVERAPPSFGSSGCVICEMPYPKWVPGSEDKKVDWLVRGIAPYRNRENLHPRRSSQAFHEFFDYLV